MFEQASDGTFIGRTLKFGRTAVTIAKAMAATVFLVLAGLADTYDVGDVSAFARTIFADSSRVGAIVAVASVAWFLFKFFRKHPKGFSAHRDLDDGE